MAESKWPEVKEKLVLVEGWARNGLTDVQICKNLGISKETFYVYKREHIDFSDAVKRGKEVVDFEVENALVKRALGYKFNEVTKELSPVLDKNRQPLVNDLGIPISVLQVTKTVTKEISPDVTAQIFWLKNRKPKDWRDKKQIDLNNGTEDLTEEEIEKRLEELDKK